jgi:hypothetical protein
MKLPNIPWAAVAKLVGAAAPLLGSLLGGPLGMAAGTILASVLGVEASPQAVIEALGAREDREALLKRIEADYQKELIRLRLEAETAALREVNVTMRAELVSGEWFQKAWRPLWGFVSAVGWAGIVAATVWSILTAADAAILTALGQLLGAMTVVFAVPGAIVGVAAWGRSGEKIALATGEAPQSISGAIAERIGGRK